MARPVLLGCLILAMLAPLTAWADEAPTRDLTGVYTCEGQNPDGSTYSGLVEIVKWQDTYLVRWTTSSSSQVVGIGILSGNILAVSYFGGTPAIVVYSVTSDDRLDGKWTLGTADGMLFSETLLKMKVEQAAPDEPIQPDEPAAPTTPAKRFPRSGRTTSL